MTARYGYHADNSLKQVINRTASGVLTQHDYLYDGVGNRASQAEVVNASTLNYAYGYDELNRLIQVQNGTAAQQENYAYDPLNNRTKKTINATTPVVTASVARKKRAEFRELYALNQLV